MKKQSPISSTFSSSGLAGFSLIRNRDPVVVRQGSAVWFVFLRNSAHTRDIIDILKGESATKSNSSYSSVTDSVTHSFTMHRLGFLFLCFAATVFTESVDFTPCKYSDGSLYPQAKAVDVSPCPKQPCEIEKGGFATITVTCVSNVNSEKLRLSIYANLAGVEVPYPGMKRDACSGKNITCPIAEGQEITFFQKLPVRKFFPSIETMTKINLRTIDDSDKDICCFHAPVKVIDPVDAKLAKPEKVTT